MTRLAVVGGTVVTPGGPVRSDVFLAEDRIVSVHPNVGTTGTGEGEPGGRSENGTVGAGAERSVVDVSAQDDAVSVVGGTPPAAEGVPVLDATDLLVVPGFIDLQCNGAVGVDLTSAPERLGEVAAALPRWGVTAWLPTVVTAPSSVRSRALDALRSVRRHGDAAVAMPLGLHFEGPFLAPDRKGAHDAEAHRRSLG